MKQAKFGQPVYRMPPRNPPTNPKCSTAPIPIPSPPPPLTPTTPYPADPNTPYPPTPLGRVLCTVLVTIAWAEPLSHMEMHLIENFSSRCTITFPLYMARLTANRPKNVF